MFSTISQTGAGLQMTTVDAASMTVPSIVPGFVSIYTSNGKVYAVLQLGSPQLATATNPSSSMKTLPAEVQSFTSPSSLSTVEPSAEMSMLNMEPFPTSSYNTPSGPSSFATSTSLPPYVPENMTETGTVSSMEHGGLSRAEMAGIAGVVIAAFSLVTIGLALFFYRRRRHRNSVDSLWPLSFSDTHVEKAFRVPVLGQRYRLRNGRITPARSTDDVQIVSSDPTPMDRDDASRKGSVTNLMPSIPGPSLSLGSSRWGD